jgi:hypothetical protein
MSPREACRIRAFQIQLLEVATRAFKCQKEKELLEHGTNDSVTGSRVFKSDLCNVTPVVDRSLKPPQVRLPLGVIDPSLLISIVSLILSAVALSWSIHREVLRPKLKIKISFGQIVSDTRPLSDGKIAITCTNFGPGNTIARDLVLRKTSIWIRLRRKVAIAALIPDFKEPDSESLPKRLDIGDSVLLIFGITAPPFILDDRFNQVGVKDPFGRVHWCSRKDYESVRRRVQHEFNP